MKVLRLTTELNYGGIEKVFELHARYHDNSYELIFVALGKGGSTEKQLKNLGYKVIVLNVDKVAIPSFKLIYKLAQVVKNEKPDIIHAAGAEANFHATIAAKAVGVNAIVCEEIGIPNHSEKAKLLFRLIYSFSDKVIAISKAVESFLISSKEVPATKVEVIYNPVDEVDVKENVKKEELLFTVLARLEPVKNVQLLIGAFAKILQHYPLAKLNVIGDGSLRASLQKQVQELQIQDRVIFLGFISTPGPLLAASTYFVLPSLFEGFGLACVEAIQRNNLVICTNSGGIPEFIEDGREGFLFDPTYEDALVEAMLRAIALPKEQQLNLVEAARRRIASKFSPHQYIRELGQLYESAIS